jgi:hypothetical protein
LANPVPGTASKWLFRPQLFKGNLFAPGMFRGVGLPPSVPTGPLTGKIVRVRNDTRPIIRVRNDARPLVRVRADLPPSIAVPPTERLQFTTQPPASVTVGASFGLAIIITDNFGKIDTDFNANVSLAIVANPSGAVLAGGTTVAAVNGVATFAGLSLNLPGTGFALGATGTGLIAATSSPFNVTAPAVASQLVIISQPPGSMTAGAGFGLTVNAEDSLGNVDATYTGNVTVALADNPSGGTLSGTLTVAAVNGVATFAGLSVDKAGVAYTLAISSGSLHGATTGPFTIVPGTATGLTVIGPGDVSPSTVFSLPVDATDAFGNIDPGFAGNISVAISTNPAGGSLGGTLTRTASGGIAVFNDLTLNNGGTGYRLLATSSGLTAGLSLPFNVIANARRTLQLSDWEYLGVMLCPPNMDGNAYGSLAQRVQPNGTKTFMILGHGAIGGQNVWEFPKVAFSSSMATAQRAMLTKAWGLTLYGSNRTSTDPTHTSTDGAYYDRETCRLFFMYGIDYDVGGPPNKPSLMFAQFDPATGDYVGSYGPFLVDVGRSRVRSGMLSIPEWFRAYVGGRSIAIFGGVYSGSSDASFGCDLYAIDMPDQNTPPGTVLKTVPLLFHPRLSPDSDIFDRRFRRPPNYRPLSATTGQPLPAPGSDQFPTPNAGGGYWTTGEQFRSGCWWDDGTATGIVFGSSICSGNAWYGLPNIPGSQAVCVGPAEKGPNATGFDNTIMIYDPSDLLSVVRGAMPSWGPVPVASFSVADQFGAPTNCYGLPTGMVFDADVGELYMLFNKADRSATSGTSNPAPIILGFKRRAA